MPDSTVSHLVQTGKRKDTVALWKSINLRRNLFFVGKMGMFYAIKASPKFAIALGNLKIRIKSYRMS